jgi:type IV pilus assembly protein PilQ
MIATVRSRIRSSIAVAGALVGLAVLAGAGPALASALTNVTVDRQGEATVVNLHGLSAASFSAFQGERPQRVVVDLAGVESPGVTSPISVFDGVVEEISVAEFKGGTGETATRVEVGVAAEVDFEVKPTGDDLEIRMTPHASETSMDGEAHPEGTMAESADASAPKPAAAAGNATHLLGVAAFDAPEGTAIRLTTDGALAGVKSFTLEDPPRLVVDLPGLQNQERRNVIAVGSAEVGKVRVGQHDDKVRIVIDAGSQATLEGRHLMPTDDGLLVSFGSVDPSALMASAAKDPAPAAMDPAPAAQAPAPGPKAAKAAAAPVPAKTAAAPAGGWSMVEAVDYVPGASMDELRVRSDRPVEYQVFRPDPQTFVLLVPGANLEPAASQKLAPEAGAPVSLVSAFAQPELPEPQVRVVVKRAPGLEPQMRQEGNSIVMAWAHDGAAPPVPSMSAMPESAAPAKMADGSMPAASSGASAKAMARNAASVASPKGSAPAAAEPEAPIDYLEEGGLLDGKEYVGRRISLDFKDVDIRDVLRLIADVSDLNVIAGDEVSGNVTIRLVDVPWDQALDVILLTKGLGFVRVGSVLRIAPVEVLQQEEEARLQERRSKEKLEDLVVKLQPVNYANVKEVSDLVRRLLTPRGSVDIDQRTNTVIMKDIPSVIDEATALVKAIDTQTPQVMIEARIVEAGLDFARELGLEWGFGSQPDSNETDFTVGGIKPETVQDTPFPYNDANNIVVSNPISMTPTGLLNLGSFLLNDRVNVDLRLQAAESNGEGKVISSPRVVTLDNREAVIEQGVSIPFQTFENGDAQLEFIDAVLSLKVTPHITADRSIIMAIEVTRNAPDSSVDTPTGSPAIAKNQAKTETLVHDGQTLVIGGIYVIEKSDTSSRVPYLWKVPVLGYLFQNKGVRDIRKELLIFVTPSVVVGEDAAA